MHYFIQSLKHVLTWALKMVQSFSICIQQIISFLSIQYYCCDNKQISNVLDLLAWVHCIKFYLIWFFEYEISRIRSKTRHTHWHALLYDMHICFSTQTVRGSILIIIWFMFIYCHMYCKTIYCTWCTLSKDAYATYIPKLFHDIHIYLII